MAEAETQQPDVTEKFLVLLNVPMKWKNEKTKINKNSHILFNKYRLKYKIIRYGILNIYIIF